jgi:hypothetical protein
MRTRMAGLTISHIINEWQPNHRSEMSVEVLSKCLMEIVDKKGMGITSLC